MEAGGQRTHESEESSHQLSRPTSLRMPEREPLKFHVNLVGAPLEVEQLVTHIKHVAERLLYHWKAFPIGEMGINSLRIPPSVIV